MVPALRCSPGDNDADQAHETKLESIHVGSRFDHYFLGSRNVRVNDDTQTGIHIVNISSYDLSRPRFKVGQYT